MQRPTTPAAAAELLLDLAHERRRAMSGDAYTVNALGEQRRIRFADPGPRDRDAGGDPLDKLTARPAARPVAARAGAPSPSSRVDQTLPPILTAMPYEFLVGLWGNGLNTYDRDPANLADDGYPDWRLRIGEPTPPLARRSRLAVVGEPETVPASEDGSRVLTVAALAAERTAGQVEAWADGLDARTATRARREASAYREHAALVEAHISRSFAWVDELDDPGDPVPATAPAFPTIPATPRGTAQLGIT